MTNTTGCRFGDVVLVPFPFTDQTTSKKRPAVVISSDLYHRSRRGVIIMAITSQMAPGAIAPGEVSVQRWREAGLLKPSLVKPVIATIERGLILKTLGALGPDDSASVRSTLRQILG